MITFVTIALILGFFLATGGAVALSAKKRNRLAAIADGERIAALEDRYSKVALTLDAAEEEIKYLTAGKCEIASLEALDMLEKAQPELEEIRRRIDAKRIGTRDNDFFRLEEAARSVKERVSLLKKAEQTAPLAVEKATDELFRVRARLGDDLNSMPDIAAMIREAEALIERSRQTLETQRYTDATRLANEAVERVTAADETAASRKKKREKSEAWCREMREKVTKLTNDMELAGNQVQNLTQCPAELKAAESDARVVLSQLQRAVETRDDKIATELHSQFDSLLSNLRNGIEEHRERWSVIQNVPEDLASLYVDTANLVEAAVQKHKSSCPVCGRKKNHEPNMCFGYNCEACHKQHRCQDYRWDDNKLEARYLAKLKEVRTLFKDGNSAQSARPLMIRLGDLARADLARTAWDDLEVLKSLI